MACYYEQLTCHVCVCLHVNDMCVLVSVCVCMCVFAHEHVCYCVIHREGHNQECVSLCVVESYTTITRQTGDVK